MWGAIDHGITARSMLPPTDRMTKVDRTITVRPRETAKGDTIYCIFRGSEHIAYVDYYSDKNFLWHVVRHSDHRIVAWGFPTRAAAIAQARTIAAEEDDHRSLRWAGAGA
jgi:hypothetical protein